MTPRGISTLSCLRNAMLAVVCGLGLVPCRAFQAPPEGSRFDALTLADPSETAAVRAVSPQELTAPDDEGLRAGWRQFRALFGAGWEVHLDARSGAPLLALGPPIAGIGALDPSAGADSAGAGPLLPSDSGGADSQGGAGPDSSALRAGADGGRSTSAESAATVGALEAALRVFLARQRALLLAADDELRLNRSASVMLAPGIWQIAFDHFAGDVPVAGDRYLFFVGHGKLMAFGATRWTPLDASALLGAARLGRAEALARVRAYMGITDPMAVEILDPGSQVLVPYPVGPAGTSPYAGPAGQGYGAALAWRVALRVKGEAGTWVALIDARTGRLLGFHDENRYARVKGGVFPLANDRICPDGCEQDGLPMPYADVSSGPAQTTSGALGLFDCLPPGPPATTTLRGPYVRVFDACGSLSQAALCGDDLDLAAGPGTDCAVPPGASPGNTHAARTGFYHLNRIIEKGRSYLPDNAWLSQPLVDQVNIGATCNAFWNGTSVNFYRSGGGCRNSGEIAGVFLHEWGHGLDDNDGGGEDNPSEAYADITAFLQTRSACIGRGFFQSGTCTGYGNACLDCTGIREMDWDRRADHSPSTPQGFLAAYCQGGSGPCAKEVHCEGYVAGETIWDLARRDLPAAGLDPDTAWQLTERLWYASRSGSGGRAYNCALPSSDGCLASSWFTRLRVVDDDDGDLSTGTPHGAALFAAFARHGIACGAAGDPSNQSRSSCPPLGAPVLAALSGSESASLSWTAVAGAAAYRVLRSERACGSSFTLVATVPASSTSYTDAGLADGLPLSYAVQAVGVNAACEGALSVCVQVVPQPFAGSVALDRPLYGCGARIRIQVRDGNVGAATLAVRVSSTSAPAPQAITLTRDGPDPVVFSGSIQATAEGAPVAGLLGLADGDAIVVDYLDRDDGQGNFEVPRRAEARADCAPPVVSNVHVLDVSGQGATIAWSSNEPAGSTVRYGSSSTDEAAASVPAATREHRVPVSGLDQCASYVFLVESEDEQGNRTKDDNGGGGYPFATGKRNRPTYASSDTPVAIPDNDPAGATSTIVVPDRKTVLDANVSVNVTHSFDRDIKLLLVTPAGDTILLSSRRGGAGRGYAGTLFDDEALTPIRLGTAPFPGSFVPDSPLSAADGALAQGPWTLRAVDAEGVDTGTIDAWALTLSYQEVECGPSALLLDAPALARDSCAAGGPSDRNGVWDAGETAQFRLTILNDGSEALTGIEATVTPLAAGVAMSEPRAVWDGPLAPGATGSSAAPDFAAELSRAASCGERVAFAVDISAAQGSWTGTFEQVVGRTVLGAGLALDEGFAHGIPQSWTVVNGGVGGSGGAATWTAANPGSRPIRPPLAAPVAIVDSDRAGGSAVQDEQLLTPVMDLRSARSVTLDFDQAFLWFIAGRDEKGDVDIRSSRTGGAWVTVFRNVGDASPDPDHRTIDISARAAGAADVQLRFHYYEASFEFYWALDNIKVTYTHPVGCDMSLCPLAAAPPPAPDGTFGAPMTAVRAAPGGEVIDLHWDAGTCRAPGYHVLYGALPDALPAAAPAGGMCAIGASGSYRWIGAPPGDLWFVIVSDNGGQIEGSWGRDSAGAQRGAQEPSGLCGMTARDNSGSCPSANPGP